MNEIIDHFRTDNPKEAFDRLWAEYITIMEKNASVK